MSEHEQYYEGCRRGMFASQNAAECGCGGCGWFLSQVDTWHECPVHYTGQPHPESDGNETGDTFSRDEVIELERRERAEAGPDNQKFAQKAAARRREKASVVEQDSCLHEDIRRFDSRNGACKLCGATFDNMNEWDAEEAIE